MIQGLGSGCSAFWVYCLAASHASVAAGNGHFEWNSGCRRKLRVSLFDSMK